MIIEQDISGVEMSIVCGLRNANYTLFVNNPAAFLRYRYPNYPDLPVEFEPCIALAERGFLVPDAREGAGDKCFTLSAAGHTWWLHKP